MRVTPVHQAFVSLHPTTAGLVILRASSQQPASQFRRHGAPPSAFPTQGDASGHWYRITASCPPEETSARGPSVRFPHARGREWATIPVWAPTDHFPPHQTRPKVRRPFLLKPRKAREPPASAGRNSPGRGPRLLPQTLVQGARGSVGPTEQPIEQRC